MVSHGADFSFSRGPDEDCISNEGLKLRHRSLSRKLENDSHSKTKTLQIKEKIGSGFGRAALSIVCSINNSTGKFGLAVVPFKIDDIYVQKQRFF